MTMWLLSLSICSSDTSRSAVDGTPSSSICVGSGDQHSRGLCTGVKALLMCRAVVATEGSCSGETEEHHTLMHCHMRSRRTLPLVSRSSGRFVLAVWLAVHGRGREGGCAAPPAASSSGLRACRCSSREPCTPSRRSLPQSSRASRTGPVIRISEHSVGAEPGRRELPATDGWRKLCTPCRLSSELRCRKESPRTG